MKRTQQALLIVSTIAASWLGMQAVHELGHVAGAWSTGGSVQRIVLHPLTISRTILDRNPSPLVVVWAGPVVGTLFPLLIWMLAELGGWRISFVLRFFAGFCFVANGAYIGVGSFEGIGDCGEMLRNGSPPWLLWVFGGVVGPVGFLFWHKQGCYFGLPPENAAVDPLAIFFTLFAAIAFSLLGVWMGGS